MKSDQLLLSKLDLFIRRYYTNRIIRGILLFAGLAGLTFLLSIILEWLFRFSPGVRTLVFYSAIGLNAVAFVGWILDPLLRLLHIGNRMTFDQASIVIGDHFPEIEDKLLNALQLMRRTGKPGWDEALLVASIEQKMARLTVFRFEKIIRFRNNLTYLRYTLPPLAVILIVLMVSPQLISEPASRLVDHSSTFRPPVFFEIVIGNETLRAFQYDDFELKIAVKGSPVPAGFWVESNGIRYSMKKTAVNQFAFLFKTLQKDTEFAIVAENFRSSNYTINVVPRPMILRFIVDLQYPGYTRKGEELLENTGDLVIPEGTGVTWTLFTRDVDSVSVSIGNEQRRMSPGKDSAVSFDYRAAGSIRYCISVNNARVRETDTLRYRILTVKDGYPSILTEQLYDTTDAEGVYITGRIRDDYGFSRLQFHYTIETEEESEQIRSGTREMAVDRKVTDEVFYDRLTLTELELKPGDHLRYYYEVWDNDEINGAKSMRSEMRELTMMTLEEIESAAGKAEQEIREELKVSLDHAGDMEKELDDISRNLIEKKQLTWEERKRVEEMLERSQQMIRNVKMVMDKARENAKRQKEHLHTSQALLEKQKKLADLLEQLLNDEMQKQMEEIREMMNSVNKEKLEEMMKKLKLTSRELEEQLDRALELFRHIEFERRIEQSIQELKSLADDQQKLAEENTKKEEKVQGNEKMKQQEITERFDSITNDLKELNEMKNELNIPMNIEKTEPLQDSVREELKGIEERLEKGDRKGSTGKQKKASGRMQQLAEELERMKAEAEEEQYAEDARQIRQILEDLLNVSFEQEELLIATRMMQRNDPRFQEVITRQKEVNDKLSRAKDSLTEIGKRQFAIQPVISREIRNINRHVGESVEHLTIRNVAMGLNQQQLTMTAINTMALLLHEALEQMQQEMNQQMSGKSSQSCQNPTSGKGKQSMQSLREMQQQLSDQLEKMKSEMEKSRDRGEKQGMQGEAGMNETLARLAAQQEAIRQEMQGYQESLKEKGVGDNGEREALMEMENLERELINKSITQESLLRQQRILSRMLQSERAEQKREQEEKRESAEGKSRKKGNPEGDFEYKMNIRGEQEILRLTSLPVHPLYKQKASRYMINIVR